jgi:hypothetical protein
MHRLLNDAVWFVPDRASRMQSRVLGIRRSAPPSGARGGAAASRPRDATLIHASPGLRFPVQGCSCMEARHVNPLHPRLWLSSHYGFGPTSAPLPGRTITLLFLGSTHPAQGPRGRLLAAVALQPLA